MIDNGRRISARGCAGRTPFFFTCNAASLGAARPKSRYLQQLESEFINDLSKIMIAAAIIVVTLSTCVDEGATRSEPTGMRGTSSAAESGCMSAVNRNYGGNVGDIVVTSSEFSQANSMVMMRAGGETWKCLVSDSGQVQELTVVSGG